GGERALDEHDGGGDDRAAVPRRRPGVPRFDPDPRRGPVPVRVRPRGGRPGRAASGQPPRDHVDALHLPHASHPGGVRTRCEPTDRQPGVRDVAVRAPRDLPAHRLPRRLHVPVDGHRGRGSRRAAPPPPVAAGARREAAARLPPRRREGAEHARSGTASEVPAEAGPAWEEPGGGITERRRRVPVVTRRELLEAGIHFGHQTRRWNPKMGRYLYGERSGIYIIDLEKTLVGLEEAYRYVRDL